MEINKNKWYFYENINLMKAKKFETYFGCVYILEYKNGKIKIGKSSNPVKRLKNLIRHSNVYSGKDYSIVKILVSEPHTNYNQNEKILHNFFQDFHLNGEVFNISLNKATKQLQVCNISFKNESEELSKRGAKLCKGLISFFDKECNPKAVQPILQNNTEYKTKEEKSNMLKMGHDIIVKNMLEILEKEQNEIELTDYETLYMHKIYLISTEYTQNKTKDLEMQIKKQQDKIAEIKEFLENHK